MNITKTSTLWRIYGILTVSLSIILTVIKVSEGKDWSWWLIWLPVWGNLALALLGLLVCYLLVKFYSDENKD